MKLEEITKDMRERIIQGTDAFVSAVTGAGYSHDKFTSYRYLENSELDDATLEALYTSSDLAATIVERIVHDALRSGYQLEWQGASDQEARDAKDWGESEYEVTPQVKRARIYSRLFGGGAVLVGIDGDQESQAILGGDVGFLRAAPSSELIGDQWFTDPALQNFGEVAFYRYQLPRFEPSVSMPGRSATDESHRLVHHSRLVPFYGTRTTDAQQYRDQGWGKSVLHRVYDVLKKFESSFDSVLATLSEQSFLVYKVEALLDLLASENGELLAKRFELINAAKGAYRAVVLDNRESVERVEANLSQAASVVDSAMVRVAGAAGMPVTILFGMQPAGQNATGASDLENWNQQVASEQSLTLGPAIAKVYRYILAQPDSPTSGVVPDDLKVIFPAVETPSLQDQVNLYAQRAGADKVYYDMGSATAAEIAIKRAQEPGGQFPSVDLDYLRELDEMSKERLLKPPDPMATMDPDDGEEPPRDGDGSSV